MNKDKFAKLYTELSMAYTFCEKLGWPQKLTNKYNIFSDKIESIIEKLPGKLDTIIEVDTSEEDNVIYNLFENIKNEFIDVLQLETMETISIIRCNHNNANLFTDFIKNKYPKVKVSIHKDEYSNNPWFINWDDAIKYCEYNNIDVSMPLEIDQSLYDRLKDIDKKIFELNMERKEIIKKL